MKRGRHKDGGMDWWMGVNNENEVQEGREGRMGEWRDEGVEIQRQERWNTSGMEKNGETGRDGGMREMEG